MKNFIVVGLILLWTTINAFSVVPLGNFACPDAAFISLIKGCSGCNATLFVSAFDGNPLASDSIYVVENFDSQLGKFSRIQPQLASTAITWPNKIVDTPPGIFSYESVTVAGGFLVPGKSTGAINIMNFNDFSTVQISQDQSEWFYHMGIWKDMNDDGRLDFLTARATKPIIFGSPQGQLLWYEQPQSDPEQGQWPEHVLFGGPDIFFRLLDIDNDGVDELLAAEFFNSSLSIYYSESGNFSDGQVLEVVVDNTIGPLFDANLFDVNGDGKPEILATNHINDSPSTSGVFAYEIPQNWKTDPFVKHTLASGFIVRESGFAQAAPGNAIAFHPKVGDTSKPWIAVSGDGSQQAYIVQPVSEDPNNWDYKTSVLLDSKGTVGQVVVGDVDNNGFSEIYLSIYDQGLVYGFTFSN